MADRVRLEHDDRRGGAPWENGVDPEQQAAYVREAYDLIATWPYVPVAVWYGLRDTGRDPQSRLDNYGLLRADWSAKPAYSAFSDLPGARERAARGAAL